MYFKLIIFSITIAASSRLAEGQVKLDTETCLRYCNDFNAESRKKNPDNAQDCSADCKKTNLLVALKHGFVKQCQDNCKEDPKVCAKKCQNATYDPSLGLLESIEVKLLEPSDDAEAELEACENI